MFFEKLDDCPKCGREYDTQLGYDMQICRHCNVKAATLVDAPKRTTPRKEKNA